MSEPRRLYTLAVRRLGPVFGLFFLAPFVGEFLLGNLTLADPWLGLLLAPLYGCGALLVRELGRRGGGGGQHGAVRGRVRAHRGGSG